MKPKYFSFIIMLFWISSYAGKYEITLSPLALLGGDLSLEAGYELTSEIKVGVETSINGLLYQPDIGGDKLSGFNGGLISSYKFCTIGKSLEVRGGAGVSFVHFVTDSTNYTWNMIAPQIFSEFRQKLGKHFIWRGGLGGIVRTNNISDEILKSYIEESSAGPVIIVFDIMCGVTF